MELTKEQKNKMITRRLEDYSAKIFSLEMDLNALVAIDDKEGIKTTEQRLESLRKAYTAVEVMKEE